MRVELARYSSRGGFTVTRFLSRGCTCSFYEKMKQEGVSRSILVLPVKLGPQAEKSLASIMEGTNNSIIIETVRGQLSELPP